MTNASDDNQTPDSDDGLTEAAKPQALDDESGAPSPAGEPTATVQPEATARIPKRIGNYHVKRVIASGGMGTVYEATQERPRRTVALKLMKHGIASRSALRRFEYESQILARLRHPGIAQVYEAGTHRDDSGTVPYFAMEYIVGAKPITQYVDEKKLGTRERMGLFAQVCDAVQHGHQKGIIHRDLKPSNILVDANGQVKIIDFGVARSTDSDMAVTTLQTDIGQLIGTLQYMSPEQCEADPHNIDTRSDVYALGVVFYELLCGKLPYDVTRVAMHEATRIIREQHPTKLSALNKTLRGDVETIPLKALEKDRERRYQTANELRRDIEHYLKGEPITARPPSVAYQLRIFARRHKPLTIAALAVVAALVAVTATSVAAYFKVSAERERAVAAELRTGEEAQKARSAADTATKARKEAEAERDRAETAEREARRQGEELKWAHYRSQLASAQWAYSTGQTRQMWQALLSTIDVTPAWEWRYLRNLLDRSERVFRDFDSIVRSVALSADGTRLATGHVDGSILLWDTATGEHLRTLRGHLCGVVALAFSPDGSRLASGTAYWLGTLLEASRERHLRVWDVATGGQLAALGPAAKNVWAVAFDFDGAMLLSGGEENRLTLWDASSFEQKRTWFAHRRTLMERLLVTTEQITSVAFSRDSRMIASGSTDGTVRTWDARDGKPVLTLGGHDDGIIGVDIAPDGRKIVSTAKGGTIRIWDASSGEQLARIDVPDVSPTPAYFSGDGQHIVAGAGTDLLVWSADSGRLLKTFRGGMRDVLTLARSSDGSRIASVSRNRVRILDPSAKDPTASYAHSDGVRAVAISRGGSRLYTCSGARWLSGSEPKESRIDVWDLHTGTRVGQLPGHRDVIEALALSSNDRLLLSGSRDGSLMLWDTESLAFLRALGPKGEKPTERALRSILSMASSPDGQHVAVGTGPTGLFTHVLDRAGFLRHSICMYDLLTGEVVRTFSGHEGRVTGVRFSRSGDRLVSIGWWDKTVRVWETDSGKQLLLLEHRGFVRDAIFLQEGKRVLTVSDGVYVWDAETGQLESSSLPIAEYELRCLALTPDGQRLAAGDSAGKIMLVDPATGDIVATLTGHTGAITSLAFSADGLSLASGSLDRTTRVWQAPPVDEADIVDHLITQAWRLLDKNEEAQARPLLLKALEVYDASENDGVSIETVRRLALGLSELGEAADAITMRLLLLAEERAPKSRHRGNALFLQARELVRQGRLKESEQWFSRAVEILGASLQDDHPHVLRAKSELGGCLSALQRYDEAERLLVESCTGLRKQWGRQNRFTRQALQRVVALYEAWDKPEQAAEWRAKLPTANPAPGPNGQKP